MGQYYKAFNLTKKQKVSSFLSGAKLLEHGYLRNDFVGAIMKLLKDEWKGDKIAWIGDYFEDGEIEGIPSWGTAEENGYENITPPPAEVKKGYLNNRTLGVSIDLSTCEVYESRDNPERGWELSPLVLLTACGNGRGGGDYRTEEFSFVGAWAGHELSVTDQPEFERVPFNYEMKAPNSQRFIQDQD